MLKTNFAKSKMDAGLPVVGTWVVIPSCITVDIISSVGLDFVIIDQDMVLFRLKRLRRWRRLQKEMRVHQSCGLAT